MLKVQSPTRMSAAFLLGKQKLEVQSAQPPQVGPGDVLIRTRAALVCGTDLRILRHGHAAIADGARRILGHEFSGIIACVGRDVSGLREGMRVAVAPNLGCGRCDLCVSGNTHLCADYLALGIHLDGGFAEYVLVPATAVQQGNIVEIPSLMSFAEGALAEPLSCVYSGFERCAVRPGDSVLVMGAGPIGLLHAKVARLGGASTIYVSDLSSERLGRCRQMDASWIVVPAQDLARRIADGTEGLGVDVCIVACPSGQAQAQALELAGINGRVLFFGGLPRGDSVVPLDTNLIHYKQLLVTGTTRASMAQFRKVLALIADGSLAVREFITDTFNLGEIQQAFACAVQGHGLRCLVNLDGQLE